MKKEKGSVTLFVLISCMFMIVILLVVNIGVMNKNRSQEKNLEEISKQYNQNETDLDSTYANTLEKQDYVTKQEYENLKDQMTYKSGDTLVISFNTGGFVTNAGKNFYCTAFLGKNVDSSVETITVEEITNLVIRQNDNYLIGAANEDTSTGFVIETPWFDKNANNVMVRVTVSSKNAKTINNDAVGVAIIGLKLRFN